MEQEFSSIADSTLVKSNLVLHHVSAFEQYFEQEFEKAYLDQIISKQEARQLGRNLGKKICSLMYSMLDNQVPSDLLPLAAKLIAENISDQTIQAACWGNLRKGFVGESNSFLAGQQRADLIEAAENNSSYYQEMFFRYPQLTTDIEKSDFEKIKSIVSHNYPEEDLNHLHEASLLLYNMSILRKGLAENNYHTGTPYFKIVENLLRVCKQYQSDNPQKSIVYILKILSRVTAIYDKASSRIITGRLAQEEVKKTKFVCSTKHDLLCRIRTPQQLSAILTRGVRQAATSLVARGSYLGRLYLDTLVEFPDRAQNLHIDTKQTNESLKNEYEKHPADPRFLKEFISTQYLNIGFSCLNQNPATESYFKHASNDVAVLSEFIFEKVFQIEYAKLCEQIGKPNSKVAFIVGGANARREYPSFDYDWYCVYEQDGFITASKDPAIKTNKEFFTQLAKNISSKLTLLGGNSDIGFAPHDPITHQTHWVSTIDSYTNLLNQSPDSHLELRLRQSGMQIAGDEDFGRTWLEFINKLIEQKSEYIIKARARSIRALTTKGNKGRINIKTGQGGLRQGTMLWLISSIIFKENYHSIDDLSCKLKEKHLLSKDESENLVRSYNFLLALRVRLDMHYGRNDKYLPTGTELIALAKSVGYSYVRNRPSPDQLLLEDMFGHMDTINSITIKLLDRFHELILKEQGYDIFDDSEMLALEQKTEKARADYLHIQAMRIEEGCWMN